MPRHPIVCAAGEQQRVCLVSAQFGGKLAYCGREAYLREFLAEETVHIRLPVRYRGGIRDYIFFSYLIRKFNPIIRAVAVLGLDKGGAVLRIGNIHGVRRVDESYCGLLGALGGVGKVNADNAAGARMRGIRRDVLAYAEAVASAALLFHDIEIFVQAAVEVFLGRVFFPGAQLLEHTAAAVHHVARRGVFKISYAAAVYVVGMPHVDERFKIGGAARRVLFTHARKQPVKVVKIVFGHTVCYHLFECKADLHALGNIVLFEVTPYCCYFTVKISRIFVEVYLIRQLKRHVFYIFFFKSYHCSVTPCFAARLLR